MSQRANSNIGAGSVRGASVLNRSGIRSRLDLLFLGLCLVGIGISSYLTWTHLTATPIICTGNRSCDTVNQSAYAYFPPNWGIPVAMLGLVAYLVLTGLAFVRWQTARRVNQPTGFAASRLNRLDWVLFIATLGGLIFSAYLTAMEIWVIKAICWWCVGSALTLTALFIIAATRIWTME